MSDCGTALAGGSVQRTRVVIELPQLSGADHRAHLHRAQLSPVSSPQLDVTALGRQCLGINPVSLIAALREEARLPVRAIRWYLDAVHLTLGSVFGAWRAQGRNPLAACRQLLVSPQL